MNQLMQKKDTALSISVTRKSSALSGFCIINKQLG